jgi:hypothetical protein
VINNFTILLTHGLMLLAGWRLLRRPDLDREGAPVERDSARRKPPRA